MRSRLSRSGAGVILASLLAIPAAAVEVKGRVIEDRTGAPVGRARVALRWLDANQRHANTTTNDDGRFHFRLETEGRCRFEVREPGYANIAAFATIREDLSIVLRIAKGGVIAGRVSGELGAPVQRASIVVLRELLRGSLLRPFSLDDGVSFATMADGQGNYRVFGLPPGNYSVAAVLSMDAMPATTGGRTLAAASFLRHLSTTAGEDHSDVHFTLPGAAAGSIKGRVEGGEAESPVKLALLPKDLPAIPIARTRADSERRFHFNGIPTGSYSLIAVAASKGRDGYTDDLGPKPAYARVEVEVTEDGLADIRMRLEPGRTLTFQATRPDKKSTPACSTNSTLVLASLEGWGVLLRHDARLPPSQPVTVGALPPARYAAQVTGLEGGCYSPGETLIDLTGEVPSIIPLQVLPGANLRGRIVPSETREIGNAVVLLWPGSGVSQDVGMLIFLPDASGQFSEDSLPPGSYGLLAVREEDWSDPRWKPDLSKVAELQLPGGTTTVEIPRPASDRNDARSQ